MRVTSWLAVAALVATSTGCAQLGNLGSVLGQPGGGGGGGGSGEVVAEIQQVNTSSQQIQIRTESGQTAVVHYDNRTRVIYQNQQYPVTALERGDVVSMVVQESGNAYYTGEILVRQSVQERTGAGGSTGAGMDSSLRIISGNVGQIDYDRGLFELRASGGSITVALPYGTRSVDADYFRRLRTGDYVNVSGRFVSNTRFELERFQ